MTTESPEVTALAGADDVLVTLKSGTVVRIESLRTRQILRLIKVFTRGAGPLIAEMDFTNLDTDEFTGQLLGALAFAIPEAEDETIDFLIGLAVPVDAPDLKRGMSREDKKRREEIIDAYIDEMGDDPEIEDTIAILTKVIKREAPNLMALGNQVAALLPVSQKASSAATPKPKRSTKSTSKASTPVAS